VVPPSEDLPSLANLSQHGVNHLPLSELLQHLSVQLLLLLLCSEQLLPHLFLEVVNQQVHLAPPLH